MPDLPVVFPSFKATRKTRRLAGESRERLLKVLAEQQSAACGHQGGRVASTTGARADEQEDEKQGFHFGWIN
jgi:hypothetical protein